MYKLNNNIFFYLDKMASVLFGGSVTLQNELLKLLNNPSLLSLNEELPNDGINTNEVINNNRMNTNNESVTTDEVIEDAITSNKNQEDINPDITGGRSISTMIDNVMSGGNVNTENDMSSRITDSSKTLEEIFEFKGGEKIEVDTIDIKEINENTSTNDSSSSISSSQSEDSDEEDERDLPPIEYPNDPLNTPLDGDKEFSKRYIKLINEIKQPFEKKNFPLIGGSKSPARRVKIINAFPYILKSSPTVK